VGGTSDLSKGEALSALSWWHAAGVDVLVDAQPREWLRVVPQAAPAEPAPSPVRAAHPAVPIATPEVDLSAIAAAISLDALRAAVEAMRPGAIFADGDPASGVMIVGETAAPDDDRTGKPFSGPAGALLDRMLAAIGRSRANVYITNLLPWRAAFGGDPVTGAAILARHVGLAQPRAILAMGAPAAKALTGSAEPITRLRGTVVTRDGVAVLPTFNPAYLLRDPASKALAWRDLRLFRTLIDA
jgi:uracil-DNA glycosylase